MKNKFYVAITILLMTVVAQAAPFQKSSQQQKSSQPSTQSQDRGQGKKGDTDTQSDVNRQQTSQDGQQAKQNRDRLTSADRRFVNEAAEGGMAEVMHGRLAVERASNDEVKNFAQQMIDDHTKANQELMQLATTRGITLSNGVMAHQTGQQSDQRTSTNATQSGQTRQSSTQSGSQSGTGTQSGSQSTSETQMNRQDATQRSPDSGTHTGQHSGQMAGQQSELQGKHRDAMNRLSKLSGAEFDREYMRHQVKDHDNAVALYERQANGGSDTELKAFASGKLPTLREHQQMARSIAAKVGNSDSKASRNSGSTSQPRQNQ